MVESDRAMGRKRELSVYTMEVVELIGKMRGELDEIERKLERVKGHVKEERFENKVFGGGIGLFEEFILGKGIRVREDGSVEGEEGVKIWDLLAKVGATGR